MASNKKIKSRSYLNKDFSSFRGDLLEYAKSFYSDQIQDFSEASVGGLLLDLAAYVGDVQSFYLDHQFRELDPTTAVESDNIERMLRTAGVKITGASPAVVNLTFAIEVPAELSNGLYSPQESALIKIKKGTLCSAGDDIVFNLTEDVDFASKDRSSVLNASVKLSSVNASGNPQTYVLSLSGDAVSGTTSVETFEIPDVHKQFRTITLSNDNVTVIDRVLNSNNEDFYQVEALSQDTIFVGTLSENSDKHLVKNNLEIKSAPRRFVTETNLTTLMTTMRFGSGDASSSDSDAIPDPSDLSLPLYGKDNFTRFSLDPKSLLDTSTLGIAPRNTTLTVTYKHGGGLEHNLKSNTITSIETLDFEFPESITNSVATSVKTSVTVTNKTHAAGGEDAPTIDELKEKIPLFRNSQSRIVTKSDLLARLYTLPSEFGRIYRAGIRSNPNNPMASQLFIISRDSDTNLIISPDSLKKNLVKYINEFRLISDAIDILDAQVVNVGVEFQITVDPAFVKDVVLQEIIDDLIGYMDISNFQIDQPILMSDLTNIAFNVEGVLNVNNVRIKNIVGDQKGREYSDVSHNITLSTKNGILFPPPGGIFELKFGDIDINGSAF